MRSHSGYLQRPVKRQQTRPRSLRLLGNSHQTLTERRSGRAYGGSKRFGQLVRASPRVLAILGLGLRLLIWLVTRSADNAQGLGAQAGDEKEKPPSPPKKRKPRPSWDEHTENVAAGLLITIVLFYAMTNPGAPSTAKETLPTSVVGLSTQLDADPLARPLRDWRQDSRGRLQQRGFARYFVDRTYRIGIKRANMMVTSVSADPILGSLGDSKVQVSVRAFGTVGLGRFGVLCRHKSDRYYVATITDNGKYEVSKVTRAESESSRKAPSSPCVRRACPSSGSLVPVASPECQ